MRLFLVIRALVGMILALGVESIGAHYCIC